MQQSYLPGVEKRLLWGKQFGILLAVTDSGSHWITRVVCTNILFSGLYRNYGLRGRKNLSPG